MYKVYSQKHIDDLQQEHQNAMEFGTAAAEEWVKGLPLLGKQQMADAARLERWEALLPLGSDIPQVLREYFRPYSVSTIGEAPVAVASATVSAVPVQAASATSLPAPPSVQSKFAPAGVSLLLSPLLSCLYRPHDDALIEFLSQIAILIFLDSCPRRQPISATRVVNPCGSY
jgi:hypothetical protein